MPQEVLDGGQVRIGIEELGGHGVPELMARGGDAGLPGKVFQPLLYTPDGDRLASIAPFFHQEDLLGPGMRSDPQVFGQGLMTVRADIDHPVFATLAVPDQDPAADQVQGFQGKIRHLFHP